MKKIYNSTSLSAMFGSNPLPERKPTWQFNSHRKSPLKKSTHHTLQFVTENAFEYVASTISAILFRLQCIGLSVATPPEYSGSTSSIPLRLIQITNNNGTEYPGQKGPFLPWRRKISATCIISVFRNDKSMNILCCLKWIQHDKYQHCH